MFCTGDFFQTLKFNENFLVYKFLKLVIAAILCYFIKHLNLFSQEGIKQSKNIPIDYILYFFPRSDDLKEHLT